LKYTAKIVGMGVLSGAQKHVNCFDQSFKCFCEMFGWHTSSTWRMW